jgi:hypothetical protein
MRFPWEGRGGEGVRIPSPYISLRVPTWPPCLRCGSRPAVRVALAVAEMTDADLAAIAAAVPGGEDLAEDG